MMGNVTRQTLGKLPANAFGPLELPAELFGKVR